jgi:hypothetical protein
MLRDHPHHGQRLSNRQCRSVREVQGRQPLPAKRHGTYPGFPLNSLLNRSKTEHFHGILNLPPSQPSRTPANDGQLTCRGQLAWGWARPPVIT